MAAHPVDRVDRANGVLLCVHGEALEIPAVAAALRDRWDIEPALFDLGRFPTGFGLSVEVGGAIDCAWPGAPDDVSAIGAVWQSVAVGGDLSRLDAETRQTCMAASEVAVVGMLDSLADAFHLDPSWRAARAGNKLSQLRLAPACSLEVPRTMVTNDPDAVRAFARRAGPLVTKMLVQPPLPAGEEETAVVFTSAVSEADLRDLDGLPMCPMIFQERIEKQLEIRATIVGHEVFSAAIDVSGSGEVDWRRVRLTGGAVDWTPCELPADVRAGLVGMLDRLGLNFGAFDLVRTAAGRHVFLELNPFGSFAFLGQAWEGPIAAAIADVLVDPGARRLPGGGR